MCASWPSAAKLKIVVDPRANLRLREHPPRKRESRNKRSREGLVVCERLLVIAERLGQKCECQLCWAGPVVAPLEAIRIEAAKIVPRVERPAVHIDQAACVRAIAFEALHAFRGRARRVARPDTPINSAEGATFRSAKSCYYFAMSKDASLNDFGLVISVIVPGFALLVGTAYLVPMLPSTFRDLATVNTSIGSFLFSTLASVGVGMTVSILRWIVIDSLHHATGLRPPDWDFSLLATRASAFDIVVEHYYRHYQFAANTLMSVLLILAMRRWALGFGLATFSSIDAGLCLLAIILFAGSRSSLHRYYTRGGQVLSKPATIPRPKNRKDLDQ